MKYAYKWILSLCLITFAEASEIHPGSKGLFQEARTLQRAYFDIRDGEDHNLERGRAEADFTNHLEHVDKTTPATPADVELIFKAFLYRRYTQWLGLAPLDLETLKNNPNANAYRVMYQACSELILNNPQTQEDLINKTHASMAGKSISKEFIQAFIPSSALTMIQHTDGENRGPLLGGYNRETTVDALKAAKTSGKALYVILGRGNTQIAAADQKAPDGREIEWIYVDKLAPTHSPEGGLFFWESFDDIAFWEQLPSDLFECIIFDAGGTVKFVQDEKLLFNIVLSISEKLMPTGSLIIPPDILCAHCGDSMALVPYWKQLEDWNHLSAYKVFDTIKEFDRGPKKGRKEVQGFPEVKMFISYNQQKIKQEHEDWDERKIREEALKKDTADWEKVYEEYKKKFATALSAIFEHVEALTDDKSLGVEIYNSYFPDGVMKASQRRPRHVDDKGRVWPPALPN